MQQGGGLGRIVPDSVFRVMPRWRTGANRKARLFFSGFPTSPSLRQRRRDGEVENCLSSAKHCPPRLTRAIQPPSLRRGPSRRHPRLPRCPDEVWTTPLPPSPSPSPLPRRSLDDTPPAVTLAFPVAQTKSGRHPSRRHPRLPRCPDEVWTTPLPPSSSTFQLLRRSLGNWKVGEPGNKESCFPMQLAKEVRHQCLACFGSIQSGGASCCWCLVVKDKSNTLYYWIPAIPLVPAGREHVRCRE